MLSTSVKTHSSAQALRSVHKVMHEVNTELAKVHKTIKQYINPDQYIHATNFVEQYILFLMKFSSFFTLFAFVLGIIFKNILPNTSSQRLLPIFSSKSFTVLVITFRSSHFELILLFGVR